MIYVAFYVLWAVLCAICVVIFAIPAIDKGRLEGFWLATSWLLETGYTVAIYMAVMW